MQPSPNSCLIDENLLLILLLNKNSTFKHKMSNQILYESILKICLKTDWNVSILLPETLQDTTNIYLNCIHFPI